MHEIATIICNFVAVTTQKLRPANFQTLWGRSPLQVDSKPREGNRGVLRHKKSTGSSETGRDTGDSTTCTASPSACINKGHELTVAPSEQSSNHSLSKVEHDLNPGPEPQYTEGLSKICHASDGTNDCLAVILTHDMVATLNDIFNGSRKVEKLEERCEDVSKEVNLARIFLDQSRGLLETVARPEETGQIEADMERADQTLRKASPRKERLEKELWIEKHNLEYSRARVENLLWRVFSDAQLLNETGQANESDSDSSINQNGATDKPSTHSDHSENTFLSIEDLHRLATSEEVERTRQTLQTLQETFDDRQDEYNRDFQEYEQAIQDGSCDLPQSDFDRIYVSNMRNLTACLKAAETEHRNVMARARALGIVENEYEQESDFVDQEDDGYRESHEAGMTAGVDRVFIDRWIETTVESADQENDLIEEADDWDVKTVGISDSISLVAEGRSRVRIDRWREACGF